MALMLDELQRNQKQKVNNTPKFESDETSFALVCIIMFGWWLIPILLIYWGHNLVTKYILKRANSLK